MKTLLHRLWTEPALAIAAIVAALEVAVATVPLDGTVRGVLHAAIAVLGGGAIRQRVTPAS